MGEQAESIGAPLNKKRCVSCDTSMQTSVPQRKSAVVLTCRLSRGQLEQELCCPSDLGTDAPAFLDVPALGCYPLRVEYRQPHQPGVRVYEEPHGGAHGALQHEDDVAGDEARRQRVLEHGDAKAVDRVRLHK